MKRYKIIYKTVVEAENIFDAFEKELEIDKGELECVCIGEVDSDE